MPKKYFFGEKGADSNADNPQTITSKVQLQMFCNHIRKSGSDGFRGKT